MKLYKKLGLSLLGSVLVIGCIHAAADRVHAEPKSLEDFVVKVYGASAPGSGVVVNASGECVIVLTAKHVIRNTSLSDAPYIQTSGGKFYDVVGIKEIEKTDLAELLVCANLVPALINKSLHIGGEISLVGFPHASTKIIVTRGPSQPQGSSSQSRPGGYALVHAAPSSIGFSGGGVFNAQNELIGIHGESDINTLASGRKVRSGLGLAIPISFWLDLNRDSPNNEESKMTDYDLFAQANYLRSEGRLEEAVKAISDAIDLRVNEYSYYILRASLSLDLGDAEQSLVDLDDAVRLSASNPAAYVLRGNAYFLLGRYSQSLEDYSHALGLKHDLAEALLNKSKALAKLNRKEEALEALNYLIIANPKGANPYLERSRLLFNMLQHDKALADINLYISSRPDDPFAHSLRGFVHNGLGEYQKALADFSRAFELEPTSSLHLVNKGVAMANLKNYQEARLQMEMALEIDPGNVSALANLAEILFLSGDSEQGCMLSKKVTALGYRWSEGTWSQNFMASCMPALKTT